MTGFAAGFTPNILPGFFFGLIGLRGPGCGNRRDRPGLVVQADVGVPHRHADITVASQFTGFNKGCTVTQQLGDVSVPSHRVEVGYCFSIVIRRGRVLLSTVMVWGCPPSRHFTNSTSPDSITFKSA